jgi:hypothetical protein
MFFGFDIVELCRQSIDILSRLEKNQISDEGSRAIAEALKSNTTLLTLKYYHFSFGFDVFLLMS